MSPAKSLLVSPDLRLGYAIKGSYFALLQLAIFEQFANLNNLLRRKFGRRMRVASMNFGHILWRSTAACWSNAVQNFIRMTHVFLVGDVFQIAGGIVGFDAIDMVDVESFWSRSKERHCHQSVNEKGFAAVFIAKNDIFVPAIIGSAFKDSTGFCSANVSDTRCLVDVFVSRNSFPDGVIHASHYRMNQERK